MYQPYCMYSGKKVHRDVSCKTRNHPQTNQITHISATPTTNHPQTSQMLDKPHTNQPKITSVVPWSHFLWLGVNSGAMNHIICHPKKYDPFTYPAREKKWVHLFIFLPDFAFCFLHYTIILPFLIADYNPNHKLLTQLRTL